MNIRFVAMASFAVFLLAAMPRAPFHLGALTVGKPAVGLPTTPGRPLVVVAFASWCIGCVEELPQVIADYKRFKGRVDFIGVDYLDNPTAGRALVKKFNIPFPVVSDRPSSHALPPAHASTFDPNVTIHLNGVTPATLPTVLAQITKKAPASIRRTLLKIADYCKGRSDAACLAYASAHHVVLSPPVATAPQTAASPHTAASPPATSSPSGKAISAYLALPHTFVIDGQGIVRADLTGYVSSGNPIAEQLRKLGVTAP